MSSFKNAYYLCNSGHWYCGSSCPEDGYSSSTADRVQITVAELRQRGLDVSIANILAEVEVPIENIGRVMVVEFPSNACVVEWFEGHYPST